MEEKRRRNDLVLQERVRSNLSGDKRVFSISLLYETWKLVGRIVETGAGKYGSSFIDHATRFFIACLSGEERNIQVAIEEIEAFVVTPAFSKNLRKIADKWDEREESIDL